MARGYNEETVIMTCLSCKDQYKASDAGTCRECYEEASETEEELKKEIEELKAKVSFLKMWAPEIMLDEHTDIALEVKDGSKIKAHKIVLIQIPLMRVLQTSSQFLSYVGDYTALVAQQMTIRELHISKSPVFKAMLENEMEESRSGIIKITDFNYEVLRSFVHYLYTAEVSIFPDEHMACDLLVLAEKYQVKHLKTICEKFITSKVNDDNAIMNFAFAHQYNAKHLREAALSLIIENMHTLTTREEYHELVDKDPRLVVEIYELYLSKQENIAVKDSTSAEGRY